MQRGKSRITLIIVLFITAVIFFATSIRVRPSFEPVYIWLEAEDATKFEPPAEKTFSEEDVSGGQIMQIEQGVGGGVLGGEGGKAFYHVDIPDPGQYSLWARVKWTDGCGNSFFVKVGNELRPSLIGQDGIYHQWHWIEHFKSYSLSRGRLHITFSNSEDGVFLDKILLTNNPDYQPAGINQGGIKTTFAGGSTANWIPSTPSRWSTLEDSVLNKTVFALLHSNVPLEEKILSSNPVDGNNFAIITRLKITQTDPHNRHFRIFLNYQDKNNYYYVDIKHGICRIIKRRGGTDIPLAETSHTHLLDDTNYHDIIVRRTLDSIAIKYDQSEVLSAIDSDFDSGYVGVGSSYGGLYLETIQHTSLEDIYFASNFYILDDQSTYVDAWHPESGIWWRSHLLEPTFPYGVRADSEAVSTAGESYWANYSFRATVKSATNAGTGLCFYYRDRLNYYLLRMAAGTSSKNYANKLQILKVIDGRKSLLKEKSIDIRNNQWYELKVEIINPEIRAYIDNTTLLTLKDTTLSHGKIGLYADPIKEQHLPHPKFELLKDRTLDVLKVHVPSEPYSDGIGIVFLHHDKDNYFIARWNADSKDKTSANKLQFIQMKEGKEIIVAEQDHEPYKIGKLQYFQYLIRAGKILITLNNKMIFDANVSGSSSARGGYYVGRDPEEGYFDDVEVSSINTFSGSAVFQPADLAEKGKSTPSYHYEFSRPGSAARDLSAWLITSGSWDLCRTFHSLVGQKDTETDAWIWHKYPISSDSVFINSDILFDLEPKLYLILCGDREDMSSGYAFLLERNKDGINCHLQRNGITVASDTAKLSRTKTWIQFSIYKKLNLIQLKIEDDTIINYVDNSPPRTTTMGIGIGGDLNATAYLSHLIIR